MINQLNIHNFKSHSHTLLTLAPLTLLAGVNGMGKSSALQSLLFASFKAGDFRHQLFAPIPQTKNTCRTAPVTLTGAGRTDSACEEWLDSF